MNEAIIAGTELGITYRQLDWWVRLGYLHPERKPSKRGKLGSGVYRKWPESELEVARAMGRLVHLGLTPEAAHRAVRAGREVLVTWALS